MLLVDYVAVVAFELYYFSWPYRFLSYFLPRPASPAFLCLWVLLRSCSVFSSCFSLSTCALLSPLCHVSFQDSFFFFFFVPFSCLFCFLLCSFVPGMLAFHLFTSIKLR